MLRATGPVTYSVSAAQSDGLQFWYPSAPAAAIRRVASRISLQPERTDAVVAGAPIRFPVLLYFGGWPGNSVSNLELINSLVRNGFIVVTPAPTAVAEAPMSFSSESAYRDTLVRADARVRLMAAQASAAIDRLMDLDAGKVASPFAGRLDTSRLGIWGYSFGGAIAAQTAWGDPRIKAVINIDGWSFGDVAIHGVTQPYLMLSDDTPIPGPEDLASTDPNHRYTSTLTKDDVERLFRNFSLHGGWLVRVAGTEHPDLSDRGRASRLKELFGWAPDRSGSVQQVLRAYVLGFFQSTLRAERSPLLEGPSAQYPQARFQHWERRS